MIRRVSVLILKMNLKFLIRYLMVKNLKKKRKKQILLYFLFDEFKDESNVTQMTVPSFSQIIG